MITETLKTLHAARIATAQKLEQADKLRLDLIGTIERHQRELKSLDIAIEALVRANAPA